MIVVIYSYINRDLCNIITTTIMYYESDKLYLVLILSEKKAHIIRRPHPSHHWSSPFNHYPPSSLLFLSIISCYHPPYPWPSFTVITCHHSSSNRNETVSGRTCNNNSSSIQQQTTEKSSTHHPIIISCHNHSPSSNHDWSSSFVTILTPRTTAYQSSTHPPSHHH